MSDNPLIQKMQKIIPATTIRLPSRGLFYKNDELNEEVSDGEIVLYPMTTLDEIIIRSPDMLFQGSAIDKVIKRCAPQVHKPVELLSKDIDFILIQLRKISYGDELLISFKCPTTEDSDNLEYTMNINYLLHKSKELDAGDLARYTITLSNGMSINLRPSKFNEILKMNQIDDETKTPEELEEIITLSIIAVINDVDGINDRDTIQDWLKVLSIKDMKEIIDKISDANNYGPDFSYKINCKDCGKEHDVTYILNPVSFFTLPSSRKTNQD